MESLIVLGFDVLRGRAIAACLLAGLTLMVSRILVHAPKGELGRGATRANCGKQSGLGVELCS
jgi:hypothetical protein